MGRAGFNEVKKRLDDLKKNGGLVKYQLEDIVIPHKHIDGLAADFGDFVINDNWEKEKIGENKYKYNNNSVKTTQIRKIFHEIKKLYISYEENKSIEWKEINNELLLLIPKITFAKARKLLGKEQKNLGDIVIWAVEACIKGNNDEAKKENFERLYQLMESLVAYHRQYSEEKGG